MTAREQAIEAAAKALWATHNSEPEIPEWADHERLNADAAAIVDAIRVPVLLNDLADRIAGMRLAHPATMSPAEVRDDIADRVRGAAEGWGA
jgi:hypothetical protein